MSAFCLKGSEEVSAESGYWVSDRYLGRRIAENYGIFSARINNEWLDLRDHNAIQIGDTVVIGSVVDTDQLKYLIVIKVTMVQRGKNGLVIEGRRLSDVPKTLH